MSSLFLPTERQPPADAEAVSHQLLVRAGLVRQLGAGLWTWLPAGWRVHEKVVQIVREEINAIGGQEMLMPVLHPAELWRRSGRYDAIGPELFRLQDRRGAEMVLAMTHEEAVTFHVANAVRSYRDLPLILYHFQVKERDEPRPRAGVLRTREFIMKDSYTFDRDEEGLQAGYDKHIAAYDRIFDRIGLEWYRVESDVGMMGGTRAHEYMAPCPAGENDVALAPGLRRQRRDRHRRAPARRAARRRCRRPRRSATPGLTTVDEVAGRLGLPHGRAAEGLPGRRRGARPADGRRARRPPRQRDQAAQRARRAVPARDRGGDRRRASARPAPSARSGPTSPCCSTRASGPAAT